MAGVQGPAAKNGELLERRPDWYSISDSYLPSYCPWALFICTDRVSGIVARNYHSDLVRPETDAGLRLGIADLQGNVIQQLQLPTAIWESIKAPLAGGPSESQSGCWRI